MPITTVPYGSGSSPFVNGGATIVTPADPACDGPNNCYLFTADQTTSPPLNWFSEILKSGDPDNCCQNDNFAYEITNYIPPPEGSLTMTHDKANDRVKIEYPSNVEQIHKFHMHYKEQWDPL